MTVRSAVLVLRPDDAFSSKLRESGFEIINLELIKTEPVDDKSELRQKVADIERFDGLFFTSPAAAAVFLDELKRSDRSLNGKIYVLGERTKRVFENARVDVEYESKVNTAEELIASFDVKEFAGKRLLFVRGDRSMRTIPELLGHTAEVDEVVVYRTVYNEPEARIVDWIRERLREGEIGWSCFFSPSGVDRFCEFFSTEDLSNLKAAAIGQTTARKAEGTGLKIHFVSPRASAEDFAAGLIEHIKEH